MVQINFAQKEIQCKIVYYGPGMSGKTTNLELVHAKAPDDHRGELTSIATTGERTLYFDYMPLDLGQIAGINTKFQLYTVPGQIYYKSTRRLVLQGVDGIVFVADSSRAKLKENKESLADLEDNLKELGKTVQDVPIVIQYNKRDLPDAMEIEQLDAELNPHGFPRTEAVASTGEGVFPTLKHLAGMVLEAVNKGGLATARARNARRPATAEPSEALASAPAASAPAAAAVSMPTSGPARSAAAPMRGSAPAHQVSHPTPPATPPSWTSATPVIAPAPGGVVTVPPPGPLPTRDMEDRVVSVPRIGNGPNLGLLLLLALGGLIAGAVYFLATRL